MKPWYKYSDISREKINFFQRFEHLKEDKLKGPNIIYTQLYELLSNKQYELCDEFLFEFIKREYPISLIAGILNFTLKFKPFLKSRETLYKNAKDRTIEKHGTMASLRGLE